MYAVWAARNEVLVIKKLFEIFQYVISVFR